MGLTNPWSSDEQEHIPRTVHNAFQTAHKTNTLARKLIEATDTVETPSIVEVPAEAREQFKTPPDYTDVQNHATVENYTHPYVHSIEAADTVETPSVPRGFPIDAMHTQKINSQHLYVHKKAEEDIGTMQLSWFKAQQQKVETGMKRGQAILLIALLCILVLQATSTGLTQLTGAQGWSYVLSGASTSDPNLLGNLRNQLHATPGAKTSGKAMTPQQYINLIMQRMTPDQKLGQMMIIQFLGPSYSLDLNTMINHYGIGAVLIFDANQNIQSKVQLTGLIQEMQHTSAIPLSIAIDQEGGRVDRLQQLDGPRQSEAAIGATNDPNQATQAGIQDAKDLSSYGINLNLAPVIDVTNVYNSQMYLRTYGTTAGLVTKMASAYLQGLQQSGKVLGTLKHFPGLGDVGQDPHSGIPLLIRSKDQLEQIDWAPYRTLIQQGNVHAIMVTHEIVQALDPNMPSSLSPKVVQGILRDEMGFQGVIMTDSLTMDAVTAYYTEGPAAALAVEAGSDLLMGASTPYDVATMVDGIKQAINAGTLSWQRIDDSVRRILMMKYEMGLLPIPTN